MRGVNMILSAALQGYMLIQTFNLYFYVYLKHYSLQPIDYIEDNPLRFAILHIILHEILKEKAFQFPISIIGKYERKNHKNGNR